MDSKTAIKELHERALARRNLYSYLRYTFKQYKYESFYHKLLCEYYQKVIEKKILNLMVFIPPRHMKTEGLERATNFALGLDSSTKIISCGFALNRAVKSAVKVRENMFEEKHLALFPEKISGNFSRQDYWTTETGGHYLAAGTGGPIVGEGFNIGLLDDSSKNRAEAESSVIMDKIFDWYEGPFVSRKDESDSATVLIQQRWHKRDLPGRILERDGIASYNGHSPEGCPEWNGKIGKWDILCLPAEMTEDFLKWKHAEDPRHEGDYLWPERFDNPFYENLKRNKYNWNSMYQQKPTAKDGNLISRQWFNVVENFPFEPLHTKYCRFWDLAGTKKTALNDPDFTSGVLVAFEAGNYCILDVVTFRGTPKENDTLLRRVSVQDSRAYENYCAVWESQPGVAGKHLDDKYNLLLSDCLRLPMHVGKGKDFYIDMLSNKAQTGNISVLNGHWLNEIHDGNTFFDEIEEYPSCRHDDRIDAAAKAIFYFSNFRADELSEFVYNTTSTYTDF